MLNEKCILCNNLITHEGTDSRVFCSKYGFEAEGSLAEVCARCPSMNAAFEHLVCTNQSNQADLLINEYTTDVASKNGHSFYTFRDGSVFIKKPSLFLI